MVKKIKSNPLFHFYLSLTFEELSIVERYAKLLNVKYGAGAFSRNDAVAYAIRQLIQPKVEAGEAKLEELKKTPPVKPVENIEVASDGNKTPVLSAGNEGGNS